MIDEVSLTFHRTGIAEHLEIRTRNPAAARQVADALHEYTVNHPAPPFNGLMYSGGFEDIKITIYELNATTEIIGNTKVANPPSSS